MPKVWNIRDPNYPKDAVYVGRPSKWGNPWRVKKTFSREAAIASFREWLLCPEPECNLVADIGELRDRDLVCWCAPLSCHADVLLELANR